MEELSKELTKRMAKDLRTAKTYHVGKKSFIKLAKDYSEYELPKMKDINLILKHYERYILKLSTRMLYDKTGHLCYEVDEALRRRLETKLITKTLTFKLDSDWKKMQHSFESKNDTE